MKHLPAEVLSEVFTYLHQNDQLRCMLVCSRWKITMEQYSLYHTVAIYSKVGFQSLINKVENHPYIGRRIERLAFFSGTVDASLLLPFLHKLRELSCVDISTSNMYHTRNHSFHRHIEYVSEAGTHSFTHSLLLNGVCPKLTSLKVCGPDIDTFIIPLLNNAPALKELELDGNTIFFDDLEHIHMNVPGLTSLKLNRFTIIPLDLVGVVIEPAASMKEFTFDILHSDQYISEELLFDYVCRKYPNLTTFSYDDRDGIFYTEGWTLAEDTENLDDFYTEQQPLTDDGMNAEWNTLIKRLGPQLKKIGPFDADYPFNTFQVLDDYGAQLEYIYLRDFKTPALESLGNSNQALSLQSLELKHTEILSFDWLKNLQKLEKLKVISSNHTSIRLLEITSNSPPTLSSLSLSHGKLIIGHENPYTTPPSNIKVLSISNMLVKNEVGPYIVHGLPQLNGLTIRYCNPRNLVLDLSGISLFVLRLYTIKYFDYIHDVVVITNKEKRSYSVKSRYCDTKNPKDWFFPTVLSTLGQTCPRPDFTLVCNSVNDIIIA
jgi:hypothetical protein